jgi:hypothetical protein
MITKKTFGLLAVMFAMTFVTVQMTNAQGTSKIQNYFNDTAVKVKATADPAQKRALLDNSLQSMSKALEQVESSGLVSEEDQAGVLRFKTSLQDKEDELAGINGFVPVTDAQLNAFADYVVQDMEQAAETITISLVAALLIVIIIVLLT